MEREQSRLATELSAGSWMTEINSYEISEDPELFKHYDEIIQDQLERGVIEKVTSSSPEGLIKHYIPHHPVTTPSKNTTKVRIAYNASAKTKKDN